MKHLFIFSNSSRGANYGVGTYIRQLAEGFMGEADIKVSFVESIPDVKTFTIQHDEQKRCHYQLPMPIDGIGDNSYYRSAYYFLARHIMPEKDGQLLFQFNFYPHFPLAVLLKSRYAACRIILTVHYQSWCFELNGNKTAFRRIMSKDYHPKDQEEQRIRQSVEAEKNFLYLADEILVLSRETKYILAKDYGVSEDKMHLVYNGLGNHLDTTESSQDGRNILFVGRLDKIKGLGYLIEAFKRIAESYPDVHLTVAGDGDFQTYLSQCRGLKGKVSFLGKLTNEEIEKVYQSAHIGVMPSFHEQCSYTAIEMMRHRIPLIGTDSTGLAEMFDTVPDLCVHIDENNMKEEDIVAQIASRLELLLSNRAVYAAAADAFGRLYDTRYRASVMIRGMHDVMDSTFGRRDYVLSSDYLKCMDMYMIQMVNRRPDIDVDFYGMAGIGIYLWYRLQQLLGQEGEKTHVSLIQEHLIYYLDWVMDVAETDSLPSEMFIMLKEMETKLFYRTAVRTLMSGFLDSDAGCRPLKEKDILQNTLKICTCKI